MAQRLQKQLFQKQLLRANVALLLTIVWGGLTGCAIAAAAYDMRHLLEW
jgi:hypothetical protein